MGIGIIELAIILIVTGFIPFVIAFIDILKNDFAGNNKMVWLLAVILVPILGSIAYFTIGRKQRICRDQGSRA